MTQSTTLEITDEEVNSLTQAILKRHGIDFTCYEMKSLKRRITRAIAVLELSSIHELWVKILKQEGFINLFMNEISVGLTSLFRDPVMWKSLKRILSSSELKEWNVWHAGCSSGEEVFSFGILLNEQSLGKKTKALATDMNLEAINSAKKGEYHNMKWEEFEENIKGYNKFSSLSKYSTSNGNSFTIEKSLLDHVTFKYHNLITDNFSGSYDIIFCRNVMIYFDSQSKTKLLDKFHKALKPGGFLIIGFFDSLMPFIDESKFLVYDMDAKIFQAI